MPRQRRRTPDLNLRGRFRRLPTFARQSRTAAVNLKRTLTSQIGAVANGRKRNLTEKIPLLPAVPAAARNGHAIPSAGAVRLEPATGCQHVPDSGQSTQTYPQDQRFDRNDLLRGMLLPTIHAYTQAVGPAGTGPHPVFTKKWMEAP